MLKIVNVQRPYKFYTYNIRNYLLYLFTKPNAGNYHERQPVRNQT